MAIFVLLGLWQVRRAAWKAEVLASIAAAEQAPPRELVASPDPFSRVSVTGVFARNEVVRVGVEARVLASTPVMGSEVVQVLIRAAGPPVLVDLGWAPDDYGPGDGGAETITGYVRYADGPSIFHAAADPARRWFPYMEPEVIGSWLGRPEVMPLVVVAYGQGNPGDVPVRPSSIPLPADNHLSYAFTWFGLAACLAALLLLRERRTSMNVIEGSAEPNEVGRRDISHEEN